MALTPDKAFGYFQNAQVNNRLAHAYLITGAPRSGKELLATQIISLVQGGSPAQRLDDCEGPLTRVLRPGKKSRVISVDAIRELEGKLHLSAGGKMRVAVIADADRLNDSSQNAFLKTLEEPPPHILLLLLTTEPDRLLDTTRSRCIRMNLLSPPLAGGEDQLLDVLTAIGQSLTTGSEKDPAGAIGLAGKFAAHLRAVKADFDKHYKEVLRAERDSYKGAADGDYLEEREKIFLAQSHSDYLGRRLQLCGVLYAWLGDCLRQATAPAGVTPSLDLPAQRDTTAAIAMALGEHELMRRSRALEEMMRQFNTNAQEQLVIEVGFLKAFA